MLDIVVRDLIVMRMCGRIRGCVCACVGVCVCRCVCACCLQLHQAQQMQAVVPIAHVWLIVNVCVADRERVRI